MFKRFIQILALTLGLFGSVFVLPQVVFAQSPTPSWWMESSNPGTGWVSGENAQVVEGVGSLGCAYTESSIETATVNDINSGLQVVTEISPQTACGTLSQYETLFSNIKSYVESHATNPGRYWAGFMLDEEPGFGFSATDLENLNKDVASLMAGSSGMSWYFTEDQPNGWLSGTYNSILGSSWPAPQVYTSSDATAVNNECSIYANCTNLVTVDPSETSPWNSPAYVTGQINGAPWNNAEWGTSGYWYNVWRLQ